MGLKERENNHIYLLWDLETNQSDKEQHLYCSKKQPLVGTQLMLPTEGTESLLSSYPSFPHPSTEQALTEGKTLTVFSRNEQQGTEKKSNVFFFSPEQQVWRT